MFVGVDIGGTKVLAGEVDADGTVVRTARRETPGRRVPAALVEAALGEAVHEVADGRPIDGRRAGGGRLRRQSPARACCSPRTCRGTARTSSRGSRRRGACR